MVSRTYAPKGSRISLRISLRQRISPPDIAAIKKDITKSSKLWGVAYLSLLPDGTLMLRRHYVDSAYYVGAYTKHFPACDLRADIEHVASALRGDTKSHAAPASEIESAQDLSGAEDEPVQPHR